jgi:Uma2 family endonuclease
LAQSNAGFGERIAAEKEAWILSIANSRSSLLQKSSSQNCACGGSQMAALLGTGTLHQVVSLKLAALLLNYVEPRNLGQVIPAPFPVVLSNENIVHPDILFLNRGRLGLIGARRLQAPPDLIIEVASPCTRDHDQTFKRNLYSRYEVKEYWIVDPQCQAIEVLIWSELGYASGGIYRKPNRLRSMVLPGLHLRVHTVFPNGWLGKLAG